jgi:hypothetical protein
MPVVRPEVLDDPPVIEGFRPFILPGQARAVGALCSFCLFELEAQRMLHCYAFDAEITAVTMLAAGGI